jgi:hypothetical protein
MSPRRGSTPRPTDRLTVGRNVTQTLQNDAESLRDVTCSSLKVQQRRRMPPDGDSQSLCGPEGADNGCRYHTRTRHFVLRPSHRTLNQAFLCCPVISSWSWRRFTTEGSIILTAPSRQSFLSHDVSHRRVGQRRPCSFWNCTGRRTRTWRTQISEKYFSFFFTMFRYFVPGSEKWGAEQLVLVTRYY